jgi:uncharacterized protein YqjF (DUF2071 family)
MNPNPTEAVRHPFLFQSWDVISFVHWPFDPAVIRPLVPKELEIDLFDGHAWVGMIPFRAEKLHPPLIPPLPWLCAYPEVNLRTYVRGPEGGSGVWFFSLDLARFLAAIGARVLTCLPHMWTRMQMRREGSTVHYEGARAWPGSACPAICKVGIEIGADMPYPGVSDLIIFLSARFRMYTKFYGGMRYGQVEHPKWPMKHARLLYMEQTLLRAAGLPEPAGDPVVCFSEGVDTRIAWFKKVIPQ